MRLFLASLICLMSLPALAQDAAVTTAPDAVPAPAAVPAPVPAEAPAPVAAPAPETAPAKIATHMTVERVTSLATPAAVPANSIFMLITNTSDVDDKLIAIKSKRTARTGLHTTSVDERGVASMRSVDSIAIPAKKMTVLPPMGDHVMLMDLTDYVPENSTFPITLVFEKAGEKDVSVEVVNFEEFGKRFPRELMGNAMKEVEEVGAKLAEKTAPEKTWTQKLRDRIRNLGGKVEASAPAPDMTLPLPAATSAGEMPVKALPAQTPPAAPDAAPAPTVQEFLEKNDPSKPVVIEDHSGH